MDATSTRALRALGQPADLDLDFATADRPALVTALLARASDSTDVAFWWSQAVGRRTQALLDVLAATERRDRLGLTAVCGAAGCAQTFEFELPLQGLPCADTEDGTIAVQLGPQRHARLRLPCGDDLRRWHAAQPATRAEAVRAMCESLLLEGELDDGDETAVGAAIAARDPLVDFTVACACPVCETPAEVAIDLEGLALRRLGRVQRELLREIHVLASNYGWREAEVLALPAARRAQYLALIEECA
ncbi:hypothetical protein [Tahibacter sp.]|uniref:hypothetical protein n=1 Tax=Tahibacter sp. TaxID=2056211 RepID=UPI0028C4BE21|nr:hypothetical protein [Tahibacter sp.]